MLPSIRQVLFTAFVGYVVYTLKYTCQDKHVQHLNGPSFYTCLISESYIAPTYFHYIEPKIQPRIQPIIEDHVLPAWQTLDEYFYLRKNYNLAVKRVQAYNRKYRITEKYLEISEKLWKELNKLLNEKLDNTSIYITYQRVTQGLTILKVEFEKSLNFLVPVLRRLSSSLVSLYEMSNISYLYDIILELFRTFMKKSKNINLQEKSEFIKYEFFNLMNFSGEKNPTNHENKNYEKPIKEIVHDISKNNKDADYDETTIITSTVTSLISTSTQDVVVISHARQLIDNELENWNNKVQKTLTLASKNLLDDMTPVIDRYINELRPNISEQLQGIQIQNYLYYKDLANLTNEVNKDYERIKIEGVMIETASRQDVREVFSKAYKSSDDKKVAIQDTLNEYQGRVLEEYFHAVQDTIDVLESFAERSVQEYSRRLGDLIEHLEYASSSYDDELTWKAWKQFHRTKEEFYNARDFYFNQAIKYRDYKETNSVIGLESWIGYLQKVEFHVDTLDSEHSEYLQLARAKANVAFQSREGLIDEIKQSESNKYQKNITGEGKSDADSSDKSDKVEEHDDPSDNNLDLTTDDDSAFPYPN